MGSKLQCLLISKQITEYIVLNYCIEYISMPITQHELVRKLQAKSYPLYILVDLEHLKCIYKNPVPRYSWYKSRCEIGVNVKTVIELDNFPNFQGNSCIRCAIPRENYIFVYSLNSKFELISEEN